MACVERCQVEKYSILAREVSRILDKYCGNYVDESVREKFFGDQVQFEKAWGSEYEQQCKADEAEADTAEEKCKSMSECLFGTALTSVKNGICFDVVSFNVLWQKINNAAIAETRFGESLPSSCNHLFEPYQPALNQPESSCYPEPYPYAPYKPEPYQRNPYQRNPYHRKPYQRNPYHRKPYQRNPYQRNTYHRNPYKRNSYQRNPYKRRN
ncbi:protein CREG1 precursor [Aphelenchoides avenae]|nr:protein CREG1 precursor [Aphelenchus avenae]